MKDNKKKPLYIKCPRCELNYIQKKQKYCDVCKAELNLIDPNILIPDEESEELLCPVCKINLMSAEEEMCFLCLKEQTDKQKAMEAEDWNAAADEESEDLIDEDELEIPLSVLEEEEEESTEDDSFDDEGPAVDDFDYEYVTEDEINSVEYDEDEDEDDEDY